MKMRIACLFLAWFTVTTSTRATELVLAHFVATNHPMHAEVFLPFAARVASDSGGDLTIKIVPGLSDPSKQYQRVTNHEADMVFGLPGYTPNLFPRTHLIELPDLSSKPAASARMLANALPRALADDFAAVKPLALWVSEPAALISRERSLRTLRDLAGLKIRAADSVSARVLTLWGATPVVLPASQVLAAMQNGQIDAALIASSGIAPFGLQSVTRSATVNLPVLLTSFYLLMNTDAWNGLTPAQQAILTAATGREMGLNATAAYERAGSLGLTKLRDAGVEIIELDGLGRGNFAAPLGLVLQEALTDLAGQGINGQIILDTFQPRLAAARGPGGFQVRLQGGDSLGYQLFQSNDFKSWAPLEQRTSGQDGKAFWSFDPIDGGPVFFRVTVD
jgi:TRAP-type C4-dicarboxylate transport system substrate-binding protein